MTVSGTVLVTGGSGFVGGWCIIKLLQQGYDVRTTVRNFERESAVRKALGTVVDAQDRLSFFAVELGADAGWDAAANDCDYMLHVASPVTLSEPANPDDLIIPARDGARRGRHRWPQQARIVRLLSASATRPFGQTLRIASSAPMPDQKH